METRSAERLLKDLNTVFFSSHQSYDSVPLKSLVAKFFLTFFFSCLQNLPLWRRTYDKIHTKDIFCQKNASWRFPHHPWDIRSDRGNLQMEGKIQEYRAGLREKPLKHLVPK